MPCTSTRLPAAFLGRTTLRTCRLQLARTVTLRAVTSENEIPSTLPTPSVKIDNSSDPFATIIKIDFGDQLGELVDTIQALKNLGLNIRRAKLSEDTRNKFYITDAKTAEKITKSAQLEDIRQVVLHTMMDYHPESQKLVSTYVQPSSRNTLKPLGAEQQRASTTTVRLEDVEDAPYTMLYVRTRDRPGLLVDIVGTLKDCNINVISAEVDTIGKEAEDQFRLSYHGEPLSVSMKTLITNALQYYLALNEVERDESY